MNSGAVDKVSQQPSRYVMRSETLSTAPSCDGHAARQLTNQDYDKYDLLIGMDSANLRNMHRICGGDFAGKLHLLMDYTDHPRDVADPWYTEDFESTWQDVLEGCQGLLREAKLI